MSVGSEALHAALRALLPELKDADVGRARFRPLAGGVNRRSFHVAAGGRAYVLRLPTEGAEALRDLPTEAAAMRAAAAAGIAPRVVAVDAALGLLLTEYRANARPWTAAAAREPRNIERLAALLRSLHALELDLPAYAAERIVSGYFDALASDAAPGRGDAPRAAWADELLGLARRYDAEHPATAFCHNDLFAENVLDDGSLVLVDFEYAVRASPLLDLAQVAGMNDFGAAEQRALLAAYHRYDSVPRAALESLERTVRMVRLTAFFWALMRERRVADSAPYEALAAKLAKQLETN